MCEDWTKKFYSFASILEICFLFLHKKNKTIPNGTHIESNDCIKFSQTKLRKLSHTTNILLRKSSSQKNNLSVPFIKKWVEATNQWRQNR